MKCHQVTSIVLALFAVTISLSPRGGRAEEPGIVPLPETTALPQQANIISRWKLDESSGPRQDFVGLNTLSENNSVASVEGQFGVPAADFEKNNNDLYISHGAQTGLNQTGDLSFFTWINFENLPSVGTSYNYMGKMDISPDSNRSYNWRLYNHNGVYELRMTIHDGIGGGSTHLWVWPSPQAQQWYHIGFAYDASAGENQYFIDGVLQDTKTGLPTSIHAGNGVFTLGGIHNTGDYVDGLMQDAVLWNTALTSDDVAALYTSYTEPPAEPEPEPEPEVETTPLPETTALPQQANIISRWKLDESSGPRQDSVGLNTLSENNSVASVEGQFGVPAADFEKNNNDLYISHGAQTGLNQTGDLSFFTWINFENLPSVGTSYNYMGKMDISPDSNRSYNWRLYNHNGVYELRMTIHDGIGGGSTHLWVWPSPQAQQWYHIGFAYDASAGENQYFIDGVLQDTKTGLPTSIHAGNGVFTLGGIHNTGDYVDGLMQDAVLWNTALTSDDVAALYDLYFTSSGEESTFELVDIPTTLLSDLFAEISAEMEEVPLVEMSSFDAAPYSLTPGVIPSGMGQQETISINERLTRGISPGNAILRTGLTYYDQERGVDVHAGTNQFFIEYDNGAVELMVIPADMLAGQDHPSVDEVPHGGRATPDLGEVPKEVLRTGLTFYDVERGIDVHANDGHYLIEYIDQTIEQRPLPDGGFVPRPEDFTNGGEDNSQLRSSYGPTPEELGIVDGSSSPKPSSELVLIGDTYISTSGQLRVAKEGTVFLQDPVTGTILLRPAADASLAILDSSTQTTQLAQHESGEVTAFFAEAYGRNPSEKELEYWRKRTDKSGDALLGAMQFAYQKELSAQQSANYDSDDVQYKVLGAFEESDPMELIQVPEVQMFEPFIQSFEDLGSAGSELVTRVPVYHNPEDYDVLVDDFVTWSGDEGADFLCNLSSVVSSISVSVGCKSISLYFEYENNPENPRFGSLLLADTVQELSTEILIIVAGEGKAAYQTFNLLNVIINFVEKDKLQQFFQDHIDRIEEGLFE